MAETSRPAPEGRGLLNDLPRYRERVSALLSSARTDNWLDSWVENRLASGSMFLGLASIFLPILAVPSVIMAVVCLRRIPLEPWRKGKARSIIGIVASAVMAPISVAVWISFI